VKVSDVDAMIDKMNALNDGFGKKNPLCSLTFNLLPSSSSAKMVETWDKYALQTAQGKRKQN